MRISDWSSDVCSSDLYSLSDRDRGRLTLRQASVSGFRIGQDRGERIAQRTFGIGDQRLTTIAYMRIRTDEDGAAGRYAALASPAAVNVGHFSDLNCSSRNTALGGQFS